MRFLIVNHSPLVLGAHATTMLVNDFVNARLGKYGPGVKFVEVRLLYPFRTRGPSTHLAAEVAKLAAASPRATFRRPKSEAQVRVVCRGVTATRIAGDGHLTPDEATAVTETASAALELLCPKFAPADRFDVGSFLTDAQAALAACPAAIRRYLR